MLSISKKELNRHREALLKIMSQKHIDALYIVSPASINYLTGFEVISTERPMALILKSDGETIMFGPLLEVDHVKKYAYVDRVIHYPEYPDEKHPMKWLAEYMSKLELKDKVIGYDTDGYGHIMGYRGPRLSEVFKDAKYIYARDLIEELRMIKSLEEINILKESARWTILAHRLLQEYIEPGKYEDETSFRANFEATLAMIRALPGMRNLRVIARFRGQIGKHSYYPHSLPIHAKIKRGDLLVTGAGAKICSYSVELERTLIVGKPTDEQLKFFKLMLRAQEIALELIRPGVKCSDVNKAVRKIL